MAITSTGPTEDDWHDAVLTRIDLPGTVRTLLDSDVQLGLPVGSPDGRYVAVVQALCSDHWLVAGDVLPVDVECRTTRQLDTEGRRDPPGADFRYPAGFLRPVTELLVTSSNCGGNSFHPDGPFTADGRVVTIRDDYEQPQQVMLGDEVLASIAHAGTDFPRFVASPTPATSPAGAPASWTATPSAPTTRSTTAAPSCTPAPSAPRV